MDFIDGSEHVEEKVTEQSPSLLTVILDTNPAAWSILSKALPLSSVVANLLVFINAHLACNYTNKVAVIASHCDKAQYLYPSPTDQLPSHASGSKRQPKQDDSNQPKQNGTTSPPSSTGNKYRRFRLIESEVLTNLTNLLSTTSPDTLQTSTSTMIAGALTLALSYINRESIIYTESLTGASTNNPTNTRTTANDNNKLQSRILLLTASPSTDLAHQYIPIMNAIFACQRLAIPIDILQIPLPSDSPNTPASDTSTVFLQQASDATSGIFIPFQYPPNPHPSAPTNTTTNTSSSPNSPDLATLTSQSLLTYLLTSLLPSPSLRAHLILPTNTAVDFRAACFCHRRVIDTGYVCSICLSIFCEPPAEQRCLTCGNVLVMDGSGSKVPIVVARKGGKGVKKRKKRDGVGGEGSAVGTPTGS